MSVYFITRWKHDRTFRLMGDSAGGGADLVTDSVHYGVDCIQEGDMFNQGQDRLEFILPAPRITRQETGILWYEVTVIESEARCLMAAFDGTTHEKVSQADTTIHGEDRVRTVLTEGDAVLTGEMTVSKEGDGELEAQFLINGYKVDIPAFAADPSENALAELTIGLNEPEIKLASHWGRLSESALTMAEVFVAKSPTNTYGCGECVSIGVGTTLAAIGCGAGIGLGSLPLVLGSCTLAGFGAEQFVTECHGACA